MRIKQLGSRTLAALLVASMAFPAGTQMQEVKAEENSDSVNAVQSSTSYEGEENGLTADEYAEFGLINHSPDEFDPEDTSNPLEGYEPITVSELCVGFMGKDKDWNGRFFVCDDVETLDSGALNLDNMGKDTVGAPFLYDAEHNGSVWYATNKDKVELQTSNACALDADGDGTDELLHLFLYVNREKNRSAIDLRLVDLEGNEDSTGQWVQKGVNTEGDGKNDSGYSTGATATYLLSDSNSDDTKWVDAIEADATKGLCTAVSGDYDEDGKDEVAVYIPSQVNNLPCVIVYDALENSDGSLEGLKEKDRIYLDELNTSTNQFNYRYNSWKMPEIALSTTSISGRDELVIIGNKPLKESDDYKNYGQTSVLGIFGYNNGFQNVFKKELKYGSSRMRFASATDADVNGNDIEELLVGGYKNTDWDSEGKNGKQSSSTNLLQLISWNENTNQYEEVWSEPKEVNAHKDLKVDLEMMEPAALAAGKFLSDNERDMVFLEGVIMNLEGASETGTTEKERLESGYFDMNNTYHIPLDGDNSAFISTATAGVFSRAGVGCEQLAILAGDHRGSNNDTIYYDVTWVWEKERGKITSEVVNSNYIDGKDEDDNGTFLYIAPANVDQDTMYVTYKGKTYGWSNPAVYCVMQSPPYWKEIQYNSETFGAGEVACDISVGYGSGTSADWGVGLQVKIAFEALFGAGIFGTNGKTGGTFEGAAMGSYIGEKSNITTFSTSYEAKGAPGYDWVVMLAVPMVIYHYQVWYPEHTFTAEEKSAMEEAKETLDVEEEIEYKEGDVVEGQWVDFDVSQTLTPSFSTITKEQYNELVEKEEYQKLGLTPITEKTLASHTIGDPSTYPHNEAELKAPGNVSNLMVAEQGITTPIGEAVQSINLNIENEQEKANGFNLDFEWSGGLVSKIETSIVVSFEGTFEYSHMIKVEGGKSWLSTNSNGIGFSATLSGIPENAQNYKFSTKLAAFQNSDISMGCVGDYDDMLPDGTKVADGAYVIGYIVEGVDEETAPPGLPQDLRVVRTTEHEVLLAWSEEQDRPADSYEIYAPNNFGDPKKIGETKEPYYLVTDLNPSTEYQFAVKALRSDSNSVMSRWVSAWTKDSSSKAPYFTQQPENVIIENSSDWENGFTLTAEAKKGEGMEDASLTYQWQKYSEKSLTGEGVWEDVTGATDATLTVPNVTAEDDQTHYRVVATQTMGANVQSVISRSVTVFVSDSSRTYYDTGLQIQEISGDGVWDCDSSTYYTDQELGYDVKLQMNLEKNQLPDSEKNVYLFARDKDKNEHLLGKGTITNDGSVTASIENKLDIGDYEVYAVYPGGSVTIGQDNTGYYLPAQSDSVSLHIVTAYKINYHLDGGINPPSNPSVLTNESGKVVLSAPTKNYYTFEGWFLDEGFTKPLEDNTLDSATLTGDVDLYAKWTPASFKINYELNGGENHPSNPDSYTVEDTIKLKDPSKEGYDFLGWYRDADYTEGPVNVINGTECKEITLYAKWQEIEVPFDEDEETGAYLISNYQDLVNMARRIQENPSKYASADYIQTCNIVSYGAAWNLSIGTEEHPFEGTYEGYDYYILGLRSDGSSSGLFGVIGEKGAVKNLSVVDFDFSAPAGTAGGIAGINRGTISGCGSGISISSAATTHIDGEEVTISSLNSDVLGTSAAGGIAGINEGIIVNTRSNAKIQAEVAGGIAGENKGEIRNVYNTGSVKATSEAGGITGKNTGNAVIQYGYASGSVNAPTFGGVAGTSENQSITGFWYLSDMQHACGNQEDTSIGAQQKSKSEMRNQEFCDILNEGIRDVKESLGLKAWIWSAAENNGYPRLERGVVEERTLTNQELGISVSGKIHPDATLKVVKLGTQSSELKTMQKSVGAGKLLEGWTLALVYRDGTYSTWDGDLTIRFTSEFAKKLKGLHIVHMDEEGNVAVLNTDCKGAQMTVSAGTMGSFGVYDASADASDVSANEGADQSSNGEGTGGDSGIVSTGDVQAPVVWFCLAILACGVLVTIVIKKRKNRQG